MDNTQGEVMQSVEIRAGHTLAAVDIAGSDELIAIQIRRPEGTGRALYETIVVSVEEAEAMLQLLMDAVG